MPRGSDAHQRAGKRREAAKAKNATQVNETMQRINLRIRQLRPADKFESEKK